MLCSVRLTPCFLLPALIPCNTVACCLALSDCRYILCIPLALQSACAAPHLSCVLYELQDANTHVPGSQCDTICTYNMCQYVASLWQVHASWGPCTYLLLSQAQYDCTRVNGHVHANCRHMLLHAAGFPPIPEGPAAAGPLPNCPFPEPEPVNQACPLNVHTNLYWCMLAVEAVASTCQVTCHCCI